MSSGADLDTRGSVIVILQLQLIEVAIPHLIRLARGPSVHPVFIGAKIGYFIALRSVPGVQHRISDRLSHLVGGNASRRIRFSVAIRGGRAWGLAYTSLAVRLVSINDRCSC